MTKDTRVHLDHLIARQSLRYSDTNSSSTGHLTGSSQRPDHSIRFSDIREPEGWFSRLVKPDFQRATCAWTPKGCADFLSSIIRRRIIPSIILWRNDETGFVYVLDGAHRLSALRAWMLDDWGDKADDFYKKNENYEEIINAASITRQIVKEQIGSFTDFADAERELRKISLDGGAPKQIMTAKDFEMAHFFSDITSSTRTLHAQWEGGDYNAAEESFLAINRQGAPLDDLESTLIEFRKGSYARVIMSIANNGASGHYWPEPNASEVLDAELIEKTKHFNARCSKLHEIFFVPPFDSKILDINVPFMVAPGHFRKHQHLIEILPLLSDRLSVSKEALSEILKTDSQAAAKEIIENADKLISKIEEKAAHLGNRHHSSQSLSIAPLIYWYNKQGSYVRALFYGLCNWLFSGTTEDIKNRKIALSSVRGELESILINYKDDYSDIQHRGGAGLKSSSKISETIQNLVSALLKNKSLNENEIREIFGARSKPKEKHNTSRSFTKKSKAEINIREILSNTVRCQICEGVVDLKQGVQYDHIKQWSEDQNSSPTNGRPTHPFCNLFRQQILSLREGKSEIALPSVTQEKENLSGTQLNLFDIFPGQE